MNEGEDTYNELNKMLIFPLVKEIKMLSCEEIFKQIDSQRYTRYRAFIDEIRPILSYQQAPFDTYAGEEHIRKVLQNLDFLMPDDVKKKLSSVELHLLLVSAWLHDIGKIQKFDSSKLYREQLAQHASKAFDYITGHYSLFHLDEKEGLIVGYIVRGHGLLDLSELPEKKGLGHRVIHIRRLAAVLCLADELDTEYGRVPAIVKELSGIKRIRKWDIRSNIEALLIQPNTWDIVVYCTPKNYEELEGIKNTIDWINKRLSDIKQELRKLSLYYRMVELQVDDHYLKKIVELEEKKKVKVEGTTLKPPIKGITRVSPFFCQFCIYDTEFDESIVFVGMPFSYEFIDVYIFGIKVVLEKLHLKAWRADEVVSTSPIFCKICRAIKQCGLALIDVSENNPNVMFELGMASAIGKRVILIKNYKSKIPSDLAGFEYIEYRSISELQERLLKVIPVILGNKGSDVSANSK